MATRDYTLGKGKVLFKPDGETAFFDLGNAPAFTVAVAIDKLEHLSSRSGLSVKDLEVISKMTMTGSFTLDEPNAENLRMFVMSETAASTTQAAAALAPIKNVVLPSANALGKWYELVSAAGGGTVSVDAAAEAAAENVGTATLAISGTTGHVTEAHSVKVLCVTTGATGTFRLSVDGSDWGTVRTLVASAYTCVSGDGELEDMVLTFSNAANLAIGDVFTFNVYYTAAETRVYNIDDVVAPGSSVTVSVSAVSKTEGIDGVGHYQIDRKAGLIYINPNQPAVPIADSDTLEISVKLLDGTKVTNLGATLTTIKGTLYFVGDPPQGQVIDIQGYCSLTPSGDLAMVGTDWMQMQFSAEFLAQTGVDGLIKVESRGKIG